MLKHLETECHLTPVSCPFHDLGCNMKVSITNSTSSGVIGYKPPQEIFLISPEQFYHKWSFSSDSLSIVENSVDFLLRTLNIFTGPSVNNSLKKGCRSQHAGEYKIACSVELSTAKFEEAEIRSFTEWKTIWICPILVANVKHVS